MRKSEKPKAIITFVHFLFILILLFALTTRFLGSGPNIETFGICVWVVGLIIRRIQPAPELADNLLRN
jgi:hypothetical protein